MTAQPPNPELQEALLELQQYLSDSVPPLVVADSVQLLMKYPPQALIPTIRAWTAAQYRGAAASAVPLSDDSFDVLKKIHMMGEFKLVAREPLDAYLGQLQQVVLSMCPDEDKAMLLENLARLGEVTGTAAISQAATIHRQAPSESGRGGPTASASAAGTRPGDAAAASAEALRRFSVLLERLEAQGAIGTVSVAAADGAPKTPKSVDPEALAFAARSSHSNQELQLYLTRFKELGVEAGTDNLFRALAQSLPGWVLPSSGGEREPARERGVRRARRDAADRQRHRRSRREQQALSGDGEGRDRAVQPGLAAAGRGDAGAGREADDGEEGRPRNAEIVRRKPGETLDAEQLEEDRRGPRAARARALSCASSHPSRPRAS